MILDEQQRFSHAFQLYDFQLLVVCNTDFTCHITASGHEKSASAGPSATLGKQTHYVLFADFM